MKHFKTNLNIFTKLLSPQRECSSNKKVMLFNLYLGQAWQTQYQQGFTGAQRNTIWFRNKLAVFEFHTFFPKGTFSSTYKIYFTVAESLCYMT